MKRKPLLFTFLISISLHAAIFALVQNFDFGDERKSYTSFEVELVMATDTSTPRSKKVAALKVPKKPPVKSAPASLPVTPQTLAADVAPEPSAESVAEEASSARASTASAESLYLSDVRRLLESKKSYPIAARRLGHHGKVIVRFVVDRDGHIREAKIIEASRSEILNTAAQKLIENLDGLRPFPSEIRLAEWAVVVPIDYQR